MTAFLRFVESIYGEAPRSGTRTSTYRVLVGDERRSG
jgi:hypothetical protein